MSDSTPVLLYDGDCGFCSRSVQFVLSHESPDRRGSLRFAALQSAYGVALIAAKPSLAQVDSLVWFDPRSNDTYLKMEAARMTGYHLGGVWSLLARLGGLLPRSVRDAIYDLIARNRHRLADQHCLVPTAEERARFLS